MNNNDIVYATYFDSGYLPRGLALIQSLRLRGDDSDVWVLCLDSATHEFFKMSTLPGVSTVQLEQLEHEFPHLSELETDRSRAEYIFTLGPTFLRHVMASHVPSDSVLVYLDADLYFFSDPKNVVSQMRHYSVGILEHRYPRRLQKKLSKYGRFNVGWIGFRNDQAGNKVLDWWATRCLEWCFDAPQADGRYADQGYLNNFPSFEGVVVLQSPAANLAPWNTASHRVTRDPTRGSVLVDQEPLIFFHFQGIRETKKWFITSQLVYRSPASALLIREVYTPYLRQLQEAQQSVRQALGDMRTPKYKRGRGIRGFVFEAMKRILTLTSILTRNAVRKKTISQ